MTNIRNLLQTLKATIFRKVRLAPISEINTATKISLFSGSDSTTVAPTPYDKADSTIYTSRYEPLVGRHLQRAIAHPYSAFVVCGRGAYLSDSQYRQLDEHACFSTEFVQHDYYSGLISANSKDRLLRSLPIVNNRHPRLHRKCIPLFGLGSSNWYHWLIEILPKAFLARYLPTDFDDYSFLIPPHANTGTFLESIEMISAGRKIEVCQNNDVTIQDCIWIDSPSVSPFNLNQGWPKLEQSGQHDTLFRMYRELLLKESTENRWSSHKRIFLKRLSTTRPYNQEEVEILLRDFGFTDYPMENLSFRQQIGLWQNAEVVAGPTGAAWTNILFASPNNLKGLIWCPEVFRNFPAFSNLASISKTSLKYLFYPQELRGTKYTEGAAYHIDLQALESALHYLINTDRDTAV